VELLYFPDLAEGQELVGHIADACGLEVEACAGFATVIGDHAAKQAVLRTAAHNDNILKAFPENGFQAQRRIADTASKAGANEVHVAGEILRRPATVGHDLFVNLEFHIVRIEELLVPCVDEHFGSLPFGGG